MKTHPFGGSFKKLLFQAKKGFFAWVDLSRERG